MKITATKLTHTDIMQRACEMTFNGKSNATLPAMYRSEHSPIRTQMFWIEMHGIPLFVASHFVRHHVGCTPYQLTCRDDRKGGNNGFPGHIEDIIGKLAGNDIAGATEELLWMHDNCDRKTPVNLALLINAQSLMDMAKVRMCRQAHVETIKVFRMVRESVAQVDPDLAGMMVAKCIYRGGICGEPRCCGYNSTEQFKTELNTYLTYFNDKQKGIHNRH